MLKAITFDFWQTLYADSEENWRKRQTIRVEKCYMYLDSCGYACTLADVEFGLEEAYDLVMTLWHQHQGVSVQRCMMRFAEVLEIQLDETHLDHLVACLGTAFLEAPPVMIPNVKPVVSRLSENYSLGIISDSALTPGSFATAIDGQPWYFTIFYGIHVFRRNRVYEASSAPVPFNLSATERRAKGSSAYRRYFPNRYCRRKKCWDEGYSLHRLQ